jgi:hypothetical protein
VLPQELSSLVGRYGKHLTGSVIREVEEDLDSLEFDAETRELLGLDDIEEILGQIDEAADLDVDQLEQEAEAVKAGSVEDIRSAEEVIDEIDEDEIDVKTERESE